MTEIVPESGAAFEAMMREIDATLIQESIPIDARPIRALSAISSRYKISLPISKPGPNSSPELQRYGQLSENINSWYQNVYGARLNIDMSPGRMVVPIEGDLYVLRLPRIFGQVQFEVSPRFLPRQGIVGRKPAICNVLQLIEHLTPARAATLSVDALGSIWKDFKLGFEALSALESSQDHELIHIACGDIQTAVSNLMDRGGRNGESKWASLQAAEKTLKAAIVLEGGQFKFTHGLDGLCRQLSDLGIQFDSKPIVSAIQCPPGIRYGEVACTRDEALAAHRAVFQLVCALTNSGAKFRRGMEWPA
jgi:hypothetical protein